MSRVVDTYPLSPLQEGMLFNALYAPHSGVDITQIIGRMHHCIECDAFRRSWNEVVARHAILRTAFRWEGLEAPLQDVYDSANLEFIVEDLRGYEGKQIEEKLEHYLASDRHRGFDISRPPLIRVALFLCSQESSILVWSLHHLLLDAYSCAMILKEVFEIYEASLEGRSAHLEESPPYRSYVEWLKKQDLEAAEKFWREFLKGFSTPVSISAAHDPRNLADAKGTFGKKAVSIPQGIKPILKSFAKNNGFTLYTCFQAAWSIILSRYSGLKDVLFASVRGCRGVPIDGANKIVGMFINTLPVRAKIDERMKLVDFLKALRTQHISTRAFEHSPLAKIQRWSEVPAGTALFESLMNYESKPWNALLESFGGNFSKRQWDVRHQTNIPIGLDIYEEPELRIIIDYDRAYFDEDAIGCMLNHYKNLLVQMAENPDRAIGELDMLSDDERRKILFEWNATKADFPREKRITDLFLQVARKYPDMDAVVMNDRKYSYRELDERSSKLANRLKALSVDNGTPVAVCMSRSLDLVVAFLATMKCGGAYVPLDPAYPRERLAFMIEDAKAPVILTEKALSPRLPIGAAKVLELDSDWADIEGESNLAPQIGTTADDIAYIIYTSGSTGKPKGVCCRHSSVLNLLTDFQRRAPIMPGDRCSLWTSASFDVSVYEIFSALLASGTLYIVSDDIRYSSETFIPWLAEKRISSAYIPPLMVADLAKWIESHPGALSLRRLLVGVEPINEKLLSSIMRGVPGVAIINGYGPTETTICSTLYDVNPDCARDRNAPIGKPVQNSRIYILDSNLRPVPVGVPGEIYIGGEGLARGYLGKPELTAERFVNDPFCEEPGAKIYRTGDRARFLGDGNIEFIGRMDFQVKVRGFRVEPGEIERTLELYPEISEAVVVARPDRTGTKRLIAYYIAAGLEKISQSDLRNFLREKLPDYMIPSAFVELDSFPLTPNGKLDREALPEPERLISSEEREYVAPRNEVEAQLVKIWEKVMNVKPIGVTDNFFDLGGHSLMAVRLFAEISRAFGNTIQLVDMYQSPTIAELAIRVRSERAADVEGALVPLQPHGSKPPLFFVHAYGGGVFFYSDLARHLGKDQPFYGLQAIGLDARRRPLKRVEDMASRYILEMKTVQPNGPYFIGGRCLGAYIALEIANQLKAAGEEVGLLAILDSYWMPQKPLGAGARMTKHMKSLLKGGFREKFSYLWKHIGYRTIKTKLWLTGIISSIAFSLGRPVPSFMREFYIDKYIPWLNGRAELRYKPRKYPGVITFFQAAAEHERDPRNFWGKLTSEGIEIEMVPATHRDILVEPNVGVLAGKLQDALAKARLRG